MVPTWVLVHLRFPVWIVCFFSNQGKELTGRLLFQAFVVGEIIPCSRSTGCPGSWHSCQPLATDAPKAILQAVHCKAI
jgi:hypothetical protein